LSTSESDIEELLDLAEAALDDGDPYHAIGLCEQITALVPSHPGALFLAAEAYRELREFESAEACYRAILKQDSNHSPSWSGLGAVLFDTLRFDECLSPLLRAIRIDPANPVAYYWRAMLRERTEDWDGAARDYHRAAIIDPYSFPRPAPLDDAAIEAIVSEALTQLPDSLQHYLSEVSILLEELPDETVLVQYEPPMPPGDLLGYYTGVPIAERTSDNPWSNLPSAIVLYRRNLQRIAADREILIDELRTTVFHELGHFLGLTEEDLEERGLD